MEGNDLGAEANPEGSKVPSQLSKDEERLKGLIFELIGRCKYKRVISLFTRSKSANSNIAVLSRIAMALFHDVCLVYMTEWTFDNNRSLYKCAEELLKLIGIYGPAESFLLDMLNVMSPENPDCLFDSALLVLGTPLLRLPDDVPVVLIDVFQECLDSIILRRDIFAHGPEYLALGSCSEGETQPPMMEQDDEIVYIFKLYEKLRRFYSPLLNEVLYYPRQESEIFKCCRMTKLNMMCCFMIKLLDRPLALFNLKLVDDGEATYPKLAAISITRSITKCIRNPMFLLSYVEERIRCMPSRTDTSKMHLAEDCNIFISEFTLPLGCLAIYYYMVMVEGVDASQIPQVYNQRYVCEMGLYLVHFLLAETKLPPLHEKALELASRLLFCLGYIKIQSSDLDLYVHKRFMNHLRNFAINPKFSNIGPGVLKQYIFCFGDEDRHMILKQLLQNSEQSFCGFLIGVYKDVIAEALKETSKPLATVFSGQQFNSFIMEYICRLPEGDGMDPTEYYEQIQSALDILYFLALNDEENRTGIWNLTNEIHYMFLSPLQRALQIFEARFNAELLTEQQDLGMGNDFLGFGQSNTKKLDTLKESLLEIAELRHLLRLVCESLPIEDENMEL